MRITIATIADYASVTVGDKLNVLGVFDRIASKQFPARHPQMVFAARFQLEYEDGNKTHNIHVHLEDEDGKTLMETGGELETGKIEPGEFTSKNLIVNLINLKFEAPGNYIFMVTAGDQSVRIPFRVVQIK